MNKSYFEKNPSDSEEQRYPFFCKLSNNSGLEKHVNPHWHYYMEIIYILTGRMDLFISGRNHTLQSGDFTLIHSRQVHSSSISHNIDTTYIVIQFLPEILYTSLSTVFEIKYILPLVISEQSGQSVFSGIEVRNSIIPLITKEILDEYTKMDYGFELAIRTNIGKIFLWVLRYWKNSGIKLDFKIHPNYTDIAVFEKIVDYLELNYAEPITVKDMANMSNMSYCYFSRHFKTIMGKTFSGYLNFIRITEAEKLLLTTDMNITEIAMKTGYSNSSYFIEQFKANKRISPKQYKKKIRG